MIRGDEEAEECGGDTMPVAEACDDKDGAMTVMTIGAGCVCFSSCRCCCDEGDARPVSEENDAE